MVLPTLDFEKSLWKNNYELVCGVDEVGRGCFAGPVVVGAIVFAPNSIIPVGIADSKLLTPKIRLKLSSEIKDSALAWNIAEVSVEVINKYGIGKATQIAFYQVIQSLSKKADFILIDAFLINNIDINIQNPIKNGDKICMSIAAASIIAKVYRDQLMEKLHLDYPNYGFDKNKGYGTKFHRDALKIHGLSKIHRTSFNLTKFL